MIRLRINVDPTLRRVLSIAILLVAKDITTGLLIYTQQGAMPTIAELSTILLSAILSLVIFLLAFLQTGEVPPTE